jgi:RNA-directed DNA polymerase
LGISTVRDRIVQTAAKLVLEPIFEADFCPTSYGFRPGRRAQDAIEQVRFFIHAPRLYEWVIEGDVEDCFGQIHQGLLMEQVRRRVTDKRVLALIRLFLAAGVMRELDSVTATPSGTPQGSLCAAEHNAPYEQCWVMRSAGSSFPRGGGLMGERCA